MQSSKAPSLWRGAPPPLDCHLLLDCLYPTAPQADLDAWRTRLISLTSIAGLAGLPQVGAGCRWGRGAGGRGGQLVRVGNWQGRAGCNRFTAGPSGRVAEVEARSANGASGRLVVAKSMSAIRLTASG